ncbi:hypothetical protein ABTN10_19900, partial [Acinetobacter baumannii]
EIGSIKLLKKTGGKSDFQSDGFPKSAVIVVSDRVSAGHAKDESGAILKKGLGSEAEPIVVPDDKVSIEAALKSVIGSGV